MRKNILCLFMAVALLVSCGVMKKTTESGFATISGYVEYDEYRDDILQLAKVVDGNLIEIATATINEDNSFGFSFKPEKGAFYTIAQHPKLSWSVDLYVKPNDNISIKINSDDVKLSLIGEGNSKEMEAMVKWNNYLAELRLSCCYFWKNASTYKEVFPMINKMDDEYANFAASLKTGNNEFDRLFRLKADIDFAYNAIMLVMTPRTIHPKKEDYPAFYEKIDYKNLFTTKDILELPYGGRMLSTALMSYEMGDVSRRNTSINFIDDDLVKGEFLIQRTLPRIKDFATYEIFVAENNKYIISPYQKQRLEELRAKVISTKAGVKAPQFSYPDRNGKMVSLSDFLGKVVYIDIWATWCGPCRAQFPHLKELEKELHGSDIVFLSVSTDKVKDKQKWLDMLDKEGLEGVQLFAGGSDTRISKDYKVSAIPRFIIIDKEGKIHSENAPRPSDPNTKKILESLLKK